MFLFFITYCFPELNIRASLPSTIPMPNVLKIHKLLFHLRVMTLVCFQQDVFITL